MSLVHMPMFSVLHVSQQRGYQDYENGKGYGVLTLCMLHSCCWLFCGNGGEVCGGSTSFCQFLSDATCHAMCLLLAVGKYFKPVIAWSLCFPSCIQLIKGCGFGHLFTCADHFYQNCPGLFGFHSIVCHVLRGRHWLFSCHGDIG